MTISVPPYGVAIHDAIASGDVGQMKSVAADAEKYLMEYGEIGDGLRKLKSEISRLGDRRTCAIPIYSPCIRATIESGDAGEMKEVAQQAEDWLKHADEVRTALADLQRAIASGHRP